MFKPNVVRCTCTQPFLADTRAEKGVYSLTMCAVQEHKIAYGRLVTAGLLAHVLCTSVFSSGEALHIQKVMTPSISGYINSKEILD